MAKKQKQSTVGKEATNVGSLNDKYPTLAAQIQQEYLEADTHMQPKRAKWQKRLKLYSNQTKDPSKVSDPLLFVVTNTVIASLLDDKLTVTFNAKTTGDEESALNWTLMATHDYEQMEIDELDYDKVWDAAFFGRALRLTLGYNRDKLCPIVEQLDPMTWQRDPYATSVNGDMNGVGAMRFGGRDMVVSRLKLKEADIDHKQLTIGVSEYLSSSVTADAKRARDNAQGRQTPSSVPTYANDKDVGDNTLYTVTQWFTYHDGKRVVVTLGNNRQVILQVLELDGDSFPIDDCPLFPIARDWDGVSIPDLIEDKQRARAKIINLILDSAVSDLYPMYLYNHKKIRNKESLKFEFNKFVGVAGDVGNTVVPIQRSSVHQSAGTILDILDNASQKAVAAPEIAQGVMPETERTLGETRMVAQGRGARMNLHASIFGRHDKRFWRRWMLSQKKHLAGEQLDKKYIRLSSPLSTQFRVITADALETEVDPDILIESVRNSEIRKAREFNDAQQFAQIVMQVAGANQRAIAKMLGAKLSMAAADIAVMLPDTPDEVTAKFENQSLNAGKYVDIKATDDHIAHLLEHRVCNPVPEAMAHILAHQEALKIIKENPGIVPAQDSINQEQQENTFTPVKKTGAVDKTFNPNGPVGL